MNGRWVHLFDCRVSKAPKFSNAFLATMKAERRKFIVTSAKILDKLLKHFYLLIFPRNAFISSIIDEGFPSGVVDAGEKHSVIGVLAGNVVLGTQLSIFLDYLQVKRGKFILATLRVAKSGTHMARNKLLTASRTNFVLNL